METAEELPPEVVTLEDAPPEPASLVDPPPDPPDLVVTIVNALSLQVSRDRDELARRVAALETFYGFIQGTADLAVRVAKLEAFSGIPR